MITIKYKKGILVSEQYSNILMKREERYNKPITQKDKDKLHELMVRMIRQQQQSDIGRCIAFACDWDGIPITEICSAAFEDANFHGIAKYLRKQIKEEDANECCVENEKDKQKVHYLNEEEI